MHMTMSETEYDHYKEMSAYELITARMESKVELILPVEFEFPFKTTKIILNFPLSDVKRK